MTHADKVKLAHAVLAGYAIKKWPSDRQPNLRQNMAAAAPGDRNWYRPKYRGWYWKGYYTGWIGAFKTQRECVEDVMQRVNGCAITEHIFNVPNKNADR